MTKYIMPSGYLDTGFPLSLSQRCKNEIIKRINERLPGRGLLGIGRAASVGTAKTILAREIRKISKNDYSMNIVDFVEKRYPQHYDKLSMAPPCALKATVGEMIAFYKEIRDQF